MSIKNILIVVILGLIILLPFVTKANDNQGASSVRILHDINYTNDGSGNPAHLLDMYIPTKTHAPTPLVVFIHGGAWWAGSKEEAPGVFLCRQGFAVASINYRLTKEAIFPAQIQDCKAAIRFLRAHASEYNLDPKRFGVWGVSAGGHLAALIGTSCGAGNPTLLITKSTQQATQKPAQQVTDQATQQAATALEGNLGNASVDSCVQAVCDWCGPSDLVSVAGQAGSRTKIDYDSVEGPVAKLLGGLQKDKHDLAVAASPITYVDKTDPPFLIVHGDIDDLVPFAQSQELQEKLTQAGVPNKLITITGGGHSFTNEEQLNHVVDFFKETLIKGNRKFTLSE